jgi:tRNA-dihydrouridine synthase
MTQPALVRELVSALARALHVPVFCKIRVFPSVERTVTFARMLEEAGCALLAVHGRTRKMIRKGAASWEAIRVRRGGGGGGSRRGRELQSRAEASAWAHCARARRR